MGFPPSHFPINKASLFPQYRVAEEISLKSLTTSCNTVPIIYKSNNVISIPCITLGKKIQCVILGNNNVLLFAKINCELDLC